ncbi:MAG: sensor domain-containing diguanylate cyclase [Desulfobacteraceae bacterium]|nr:sensor domain-containing diguanylate cyclase [Desulfobacteraceae bacterium]
MSTHTPQKNASTASDTIETLKSRIHRLSAEIERLKFTQENYRYILDNAQEGFIRMDEKLFITEANGTFTRILGYPETEVLSTRPSRLYDRKSVDFYSASKYHLSFEAVFKTKAGGRLPILFNRSTLRDASGNITGYIAFLIDLSELKYAREQLKKSREKYRDLSLRDNLTGLFNTRYLYKQLGRLTRSHGESRTPFSIIFMDMDYFKRTVDQYGHLNGSLALQEVAGTIRKLLTGDAFGVAYGGDEFVVVLPGYDKSKARKKAVEIQEQIKNTTYLTQQGLQVMLCASFGVATFPDDATDRSALLGLADKAMFRIKESGKDGVGTTPDRGAETR